MPLIKPALAALASVPSRRAMSKLRRRGHIFSQETTIHGFRELNNSKKWWQKALWIFGIAACTGCFLLQAYTQVHMYLNERTGMSVRALSPTEPYVFPSLILAVPNWLWIDGNKLVEYNITYEQLTVAKSYLAPRLHYHSEMPLSVAKEELRRKIEEMNIIDLRQFYSALARDDAGGLTFSSLLVTPHVNESVFTKRLFYREVCFYTLNTGSPDKSTFGGSQMITFFVDFSKFLENASDHFEFFRETYNPQNNTPQDLRPFLVTQDFTGQIYVQPGYRYSIFYSVRVYRPMVSCSRKFEGDALYYNKTCVSACTRRVNVEFNVSSCYPYSPYIAHYIPVTRPLCSQGFYVNESLTNYGSDVPEYRSLTEDEKVARREAIDKCMKTECLPPCSQWLSTPSFIVTEILSVEGRIQSYSLIEILFPDRSVVIVMEEATNYFWHDLASDVGGLLGLWLGASVMSLCQLVHLCAWGTESARMVNYPQ